MQTKIVLKYIEGIDYKNCYLVGVEKGALDLVKNGYVLDLAISDFDSVKDTTLIKNNSKEFIKLDSKKDYTDLESALLHLDNSHLLDLIVIGGLEGARCDHFLTNVLLSFKYKISFYDVSNKLIFLNKGIYELNKDSYKYFSFYSKKGTKIRFNEGFLYNGDYKFKSLDTKFISNELKEDKGRLSVSNNTIFIAYK